MAEPSPETNEQIGRVCTAFAALEMHTEVLILGMLRLNQDQARAFVWRMQLQQRWQLICRESKSLLQPDDQSSLRTLKKRVERVARDRNIVVHGLVTAFIVAPSTPPRFGAIISTVQAPPPFQSPPCWTMFMGEDAGKNFPISTEAVRMIYSNIIELNEEVARFNEAHGYATPSFRSKIVERDWPLRLGS